MLGSSAVVACKGTWLTCALAASGRGASAARTAAASCASRSRGWTTPWGCGRPPLLRGRLPGGAPWLGGGLAARRAAGDGVRSERGHEAAAGSRRMAPEQVATGRRAAAAAGRSLAAPHMLRAGRVLAHPTPSSGATCSLGRCAGCPLQWNPCRSPPSAAAGASRMGEEARPTGGSNRP
jgi:hypothetical protein